MFEHFFPKIVIVFATLLQKMRIVTKDILKEARLSVTQPREEILNYLMIFDEAVSASQLEKDLQEFCNRSTIYRNLAALTEAGLIHRINLDGESRYKIHPKLVNENFDVNHPHFECLKCGRLFCLDNQKIKYPELPKGFVAIEVNYVIYGYCDNCKIN